MSKLSKLPLLMHTLRNPGEFRDRIGTAWQVRTERATKGEGSYETGTLEEALAIIETSPKCDAAAFFNDPDLAAIEASVTAAQRVLESKAPFSMKHNGDARLGRVCYAVARAIRAETVLETGVAFSVTSAYLLQALRAAGPGKLWSVDLPPLGPQADDYVGFLIPQELKGRWELRRGHTKRVLPTLLPMLGRLDMFIQDSLHTYRTITDELTAVWPYLRSGGVLIADDIGGNRAFADFAGRVSHSGFAVVQEMNKDSMFGVLVKG